MSQRKWTPEQREQLRLLRERGEEARANMQAILDRLDARREAEEQRRERRRQIIRRLIPFRRAA
jgi:hypothetical protein